MLDFQARKSFQVFGDLESCVKFHHVICILIPRSPMTPSVFFFTSCCCLFKRVVNCTSHLLDVGGTLPGIQSQRLFSVSLSEACLLELLLCAGVGSFSSLDVFPLLNYLESGIFLPWRLRHSCSQQSLFAGVRPSL